LPLLACVAAALRNSFMRLDSPTNVTSAYSFLTKAATKTEAKAKKTVKPKKRPAQPELTQAEEEALASQMREKLNMLKR